MQDIASEQVAAMQSALKEYGGLSGVVVHTRDGCPFSAKAVATLTGTKMRVVRVEDMPPHVDAVFRQRTGSPTLPRIFYNGSYQGGSEAAYKLARRLTSEKFKMTR